MLQEVKVLSGQDIFDLVIKTGYTIDFIYKMIRENPYLDGINYDFEANPQRVITYDDAFKIPRPPQLTRPDAVLDGSQRSFTAIDRQNTFDIVTQTYGSLDFTIQLFRDNNINDLNSGNLKGLTFNFNATAISDIGFYNRLKRSSLIIATSDISGTPDVETFYRITENGDRRVTETFEPRTYQ